MKLIKISILIILLVSPILSFAQKAYEQINYVGNFNGITVKLSLADGYLLASNINLFPKTKKTITFTPESDAPDAKNAIKFSPNAQYLNFSKNYFILYGMEESYAKAPLQISGSYYNGIKQYKIIFKKEK